MTRYKVLQRLVQKRRRARDEETGYYYDTKCLSYLHTDLREYGLHSLLCCAQSYEHALRIIDTITARIRNVHESTRVAFSPPFPLEQIVEDIKRRVEVCFNIA